MVQATKYTFDLEFRGEADLVSNAARARQKKTMTTDEIDTMCARARAEGAKAGQVRAAENTERAIDALTVAIRAALDTSHAEIETLRSESAEIALAMAKRIAPAALAALPAGDVEIALRQAMHQAILEPRLTLRAAPAVAEVLESRLAEIAQEEGYDGRVMMTADPSLTGGDCRIEWRGGGAERSEAAIEAALTALIAHRFSHSSPAKD